MKTFAKTIKGLFLGGLVLATLVSGVPDALAATLNTDPQDYATLRAKNNTDFPNSNINWAPTASADAGETVAFAVYYHNTGADTATNLRMRLTPQSTGTANTQSFTAYVWADNAPQVSGVATIYLSSAQSMAFQNGTVIWRPNQTVSGSQTLPNSQNGSEIFSSNGLLLGDIASGWSTQGSVVLNFLVSGSGGGGNQLPSVTTYPADSVSGNFAILKGFVDPNGTSNTTRWFEWGTQSSSLYNSTTKLGQGSSSGTFSDTVTGLSSGTTYYYRAVAQNSAGTVYGGVQSFVTSGGGNQQPFVSTNSATSVSANNATLNCYVNPYSSSNTTRWFEWGTTQSMTNRTNTVNHGSSASNASEYISGLSNNTTYYFRCAAQNQYGTSYGSMLSFYTGTGGGVQATAITNLATNIGETSARLNGLGLNLSNIATDGWFEWGTSQSLGNTGSRITLGSVSSNSFYQSLFGLSPNTTYYFRAVVENSNGKAYGDILNFRMNSSYIPPVIPPEGPVKVRDASITKTLVNLTQANGTDTSTSALRGHTVRFTIKAENTGDYTLANTSIKDRIPYYLEFANATEKLAYNDPQREVVWFIGDLPPRESRTVILDVIITDDAPMGTVITNIARIEADRLTKNSNEVTIRVSDTVTGTVAGAATFFAGGAFFPTTFLGWLLLAILILIVILIIRTLVGMREKDRRNSNG